MWIVMTSAAKMPSSCWGRYCRVALVQLTQDYTARNLRPKMISTHARGVVRVIDCGSHFVGKTKRCKSAQVIAAAEKRAAQLNNLPEVTPDMLVSYGSA